MRSDEESVLTLLTLNISSVTMVTSNESIASPVRYAAYSFFVCKNLGEEARVEERRKEEGKE